MISGDNIDAVQPGYKCLIHLDRLSITFRYWSGSTFHDIRHPDYVPAEQVYNSITLLHDTSPGLGAFYHSFKVFYKGFNVGKLHSATKLKRRELQFDFAKEVFYSFSPGFWYEIYQSLILELGIIYNNIHYVEISVDTDKNLIEPFSFFYKNALNNKLRTGDRYKMSKRTTVHVMNNGASFVVAGSDNEIAIYDKTKFSEQFILDYFTENGLSCKEVNRIECRLSWNYLRYLRNKKLLDIDVETLTDKKKLATIFRFSVTNKVVFMDLLSKTYDKERNPHYSKISVVDDLPIETADIGRLNPEYRVNHYKNGDIDENIMRQNYYRFLETGNRKYFRNFISSSSVAGCNKSQLLNFVRKHNIRYNGNRTSEIQERMEFAQENLCGLPKRLRKVITIITNKLHALF